MSVHPCISCGSHVRPKQHAVQCDGCDTGITLLQYRTAVRYNVDINWQCENCANPETSDLMDVADHDANLSDLVDALSNSGYSLTDTEPMDLLSPPQSPQSEPSTPEALAPMEASFTVDTAMMQIFQVPEQIDEDILAPPPPPDFEPVPDGPTTYEKVRSSSQRGKDKLIDNNGYTFTYRKTYASGNIVC